MPRETLQERWEKLDHDKGQRRLTMAAGATALGAAGLRATPLAARGISRLARGWKPKGPRAVKVQSALRSAGHGEGAQRFERAANTTGIVAAGVGAGSSFKWGSQLKRDIATQEQQLGVKPKPSVDLAKAMWRRDDEWKQHVSPGAARWEKTTRKHRRRNVAAAAGWSAAAGGVGAAGATLGTKTRSPAVIVASAPVVAASVINANRRAQYARGWGEKGRQVRRRGRARAQGISDDVPAKELPALVGKARFPVVRPPKAYRFNPQRAGAMSRRGPRLMYRRGTV